ncbi:glucose 1-dehydrogenase [uncultured Chitinophaga sp.]|uniref:glucose 1-dehydrogenase n=1 Tax=uncultured Chitinophaga sp. TaxID=339340 RepID=UPI0026143022|nr:glucose 1-dehydrogenase [uncultured Chitinophaga sp.]
MSDLTGKSIVITGAAMGLGQAAAQVCAASGASLTLVDFNEKALNETAADIRKAHPDAQITTVSADVSQEEEVKKYVAAAMDAYGRIDGFNNNAGIEGKQAPMAEYDLAVFEKVIEINLMGVYYGLRHILPIMVKQAYGRIVNVASVGGIRGVLHQSPYVASKHAVSGMTKTAALEYAKHGITANAIAPGAILTPMVAGAFRQMNPADPKAAETEYAKDNPSKRLGLPVEVANVVAFLLSDDCSYVNGQTIAIDGGQSNAYGPV